MQLIKATDRDNDRLLHYFAQMPYPGPIELRTRRMFNFFNQYRIQSEDSVTYLLQNDSHQIEAMASLIFRSGKIDGETETIGYATDLRVSPTRKAILNWSHHFLPVIEAERAKRNCNYIFSVVAHSQKQAYNAFIRPRNVKRQMPRYHLFRRFNLVSLHGLWPFHDLPLRGIKVRNANSNDLLPIAEYIMKKTHKRPLRYFDSVDSFRKSLERWHDLFIENFLVAFDKNGNVIGCTAPWSPERVQRFSPVQYGQKAQNLSDVLDILSLFRIAHSLPKVGAELQFRHLTHLHADNPDIFYSLLFNAFEQAGKKEFLIYPHFEGELLTMPPKSFISSETPYGLYCILSPNDPIPDFLKPRSFQSPPVFEPAFI
jgi:hypothetical protein